ncbi:MAG: hypothetical protein ABW352_14580 [Polyangiales bacterium]
MEQKGGEPTFGPASSETGRYLYARHGDGAEVEYVEWNQALRSRILGR